MEGKENMAAIGAEGHSNYQAAPRPDVQPQVTVSLPVMTPTSAGMPGSMEKKKRGRPRKYGPDAAAAKAISPVPISSAEPTPAVVQSSGKRGRGRSSKSESKYVEGAEMRTMGGGGCTDAAHFTPHVITVNPGEDVTARIISFCQQGPRAICILSANGTVSNATLRQTESSGGTLTYEGRFEIVNLCGSFTPTEREGTRYREGGLSVSLSHPNGRVVGGCVAGLLVAAGPVQIIVASFLPSSHPEQKPRKRKSNPTTYPAALPAPSTDKDEACNGQGGQTTPVPPPQPAMPSPFQRDAWPNQHVHAAMHDPRNTATDINISLTGGMQ